MQDILQETLLKLVQHCKQTLQEKNAQPASGLRSYFWNVFSGPTKTPKTKLFDARVEQPPLMD